MRFETLIRKLKELKAKPEESILMLLVYYNEKILDLRDIIEILFSLYSKEEIEKGIQKVLPIANEQTIKKLIKEFKKQN